MRDKDCRDLARNLVETLGPLRAAHVAAQYGWRDVELQIDQDQEALQAGDDNEPAGQLA